MKQKFKSRLLDIFACHTLIVNPKLDDDDAKRTAKISAMITVCLPLIALLGTFVAVYSEPSTLSTVNTVIVVSVLAIYFGVSGITDKIFDRNLPEIRRRAALIGGDPRRGASWARRHLAGIYCANLAVLAAIVVVVRLLG